MIELLSKEIIQEIMTMGQEPFLSLYMPTHRSHPENLQDPIRFKNLLKQLEESLLLKYSTGEVKKHMEPMEALVNDDSFWNHTLNGLAVFSATGLFKIVGLPVSIDELAIVADSFHTKPLRQYLQSTDRYHVLGLSLHEIQFFEGNRHSLVEIELTADIPKTLTDALGDELTDKHSTVASYGGTGAESTSMHHGHGGRNEEGEKDAERFFRVVANNIYERYSKPTGLPLILAALPEHFSLFQKVNKNPMLLSQSIAINPTSVSTDKLANLAWTIMEPEYLLKLDSFVSGFEQAKANGKGSNDVKEVAAAAVEGRVDTLLIEADRMIAMRITNLVTGNTQKKDLTNPKVDDLLDDMAELVTEMGGKVMVLPTEKIPSETGLAAIFRY
jgi:peptide subunit release factor 1 (eRF1)